MGTRPRWVMILAGMMISLVCGFAAVRWGARGVEVASWLAGIGGFMLAMVTLSLVRGHDREVPGGRLSGAIRRLVVTDRGVTIEESGAPPLIPAQRPAEPQPSLPSSPSLPSLSQRELLAPVAALPPAPAVIVADGLIGRDAQIEQIMAPIRNGRPGLYAVLGGHGMGKTTFLSLLRVALAREAPDVLVLPMHGTISVERYGLDPAFRGEYGERASEDVARRVLERSSQLLHEIVRDLDQSFRGFTTAVAAARSTVGGSGVNVVNVMKATRRAAAGAAMTTNVMQGAPRDRTITAQAEVDDAFVSDWRQWLRGRRAVLIVDGFESLVDDAVGQWFIQLASRLAGTVVVPVIPDDDHGAHAARLQHPDHSQRLTQFTVEEIRGYLAHRFGEAATPELAGAVQRATGGHPFGLRLVAKLIEDNQPAGLEPAGLRTLLARLAIDGASDTAAIVGAVVDRHRRPELWCAVELASLLHSFDAPLLQRLLAADPAGAEARADRAIAQCERLGLLEPLAMPGQFRLHDFIRPALAGRIKSLEPERWARVHRLAAEYYYDRVAGFEERTDKPFGSWFKYEDPDWQSYQSEWLFHSAQLSEQRHVVRCQFLMVFLEAFWWWGMYIDFPFCRQLVETWRRAARDAQDRALAEQAERFLRHWVPGPDPKPGPTWEEARRALRGMRDLCGLDLSLDGTGLAPEVAETRRMASLHLRMFAAQTWSADGQPSRAYRDFAALEAEMVGACDEVVLGWFYYEWASIAVDAGEPAAAARHCRRASELAQAVAEDDELDTELLANLHRCLADLLRESDPVRASEQYGLSVRDAYRHQRVPNAVAGTRNPPDHYTQRFYQEMTERAAAWALATRDRPEWPAILAALVAPLAGTVPSGLPADGAGAVAELFPAGPDDSDLYQDSSPFVDRWGEVADQLELDDERDFVEINELADRIMAAPG